MVSSNPLSSRRESLFWLQQICRNLSIRANITITKNDSNLDEVQKSLGQLQVYETGDSNGLLLISLLLISLDVK